MDWMPQAIREGIFTILFISGPLVVLAAGLGLTIGIIQAATQVQEQTLGSAVKIIGLFIALIIFGFYMFQYLSKYTSQHLERAFKLIPTLGAKALPRRNFLEVPLGKEQEAVGVTELQQFQEPNRKSHGENTSLDEPEISTINENIKPERLAQPASQVRPNPDIDAIKKQKLNIVRTDPVIATPSQPKVIASPPKTPVIASPAKVEASKPVLTPVPAQKPKAVAPSKPIISQPEPIQEPKRLPRSSASDRLSKLKSLGGQ